MEIKKSPAVLFLASFLCSPTGLTTLNCSNSFDRLVFVELINGSESWHFDLVKSVSETIAFNIRCVWDGGMLAETAVEREVWVSGWGNAAKPVSRVCGYEHGLDHGGGKGAIRAVLIVYA